MTRLLTLRRNLARLLTRDEVDDNFVNVASDFSGAVDPATLTGAYVAPYMRWADTGTGWLKRRNAANNAWEPEQRLLRRTVQPFGADELPTVDSGPVYVNGQGMAEWDAAAGKYRVKSPVPVGAVAWWPLRSSIPAGRIPADGQTISRATFPDLAAMVLAGTVPLATEADWLADPRNRGCYTAGDGSTTIRVPDLNGRSTGSLGRVFLSGDGTDSNGVWGAIQRDQFQKHHHYINIKTASGGADVYGQSNYGAGSGPQYSSVGEAIQFDPQVGPPRSGDKTHPQNVTGVWTIQAFGAVTNPGSADAAQLASDYAVLNAGFQTLNAAFQTVRGQAFGVGQSMQNVAGSRTIGVAYTNTTGRPIVVYIAGDTNTSAGGNLGITIGGLFVARSIWASQGIALAVTAVIPPGIAYVANASGISLSQWQEYR
ncbi:phage tail protein [Achromobacter xylosoxidans]|uniref:phage tail protein n=1 Tax=Alcaligenes xylosoxydans xylosoxydans TaxID=85698 RepID=UPI00069F614D|nr:phage tail protein [Achromobacter xylosoxidans]